jgi:catabolite regulation protein CreA
VAGASAKGATLPVEVVTGGRSGKIVVFTVKDPASKTVTCGITQPGAANVGSGQLAVAVA